jgi:arginine decarboxylase-like protein
VRATALPAIGIEVRLPTNGMGQDWWSGGEEGRGRRRTVILNDRWYQAPR